MRKEIEPNVLFEDIEETRALIADKNISALERLQGVLKVRAGVITRHLKEEDLEFVERVGIEQRLDEVNATIDLIGSYIEIEKRTVQ